VVEPPPSELAWRKGAHCRSSSALLLRLGLLLQIQIEAAGEERKREL
jgi:hypothetical protein